MVVVVREWGCSGGQSPVVMRLWIAGVYLSPPPPVPQGHVHPCTVACTPPVPDGGLGGRGAGRGGRIGASVSGVSVVGVWVVGTRRVLSKFFWGFLAGESFPICPDPLLFPYFLFPSAVCPTVPPLPPATRCRFIGTELERAC